MKKEKFELYSHDSQRKGLSDQEAEERIKEYGYNLIGNTTRKRFYLYWLEAMKDITILILLLAAVLSCYVAVQTHPDDFTEPIVIFIIILLNIYLSIRQQKGAEKSMDALKKLNISTSIVYRNGKLEKLPSSDLVPGDVVQLSLGDRIPADAKILTCRNFFVDESFLTGESEPNEKKPASATPNNESSNAMEDIVFSGSLVVSGNAEVIVQQTGLRTEIGKLSQLVSNTTATIAPLQIRMQKLGKSLAILAISAGAAAVAIGIMKGYPLESSIMVAIAMAVAAIPEVLPVVVTISLAVGMKSMADKKTIVKTPSTVETIGNVSVICSDKTGTITANKMTLEKLRPLCSSLPTVIAFAKDERTSLLCLFYLASGMERAATTHGNPTELAIKQAVDSQLTKENQEKLFSAFTRVYEIPFDSQRKRMTVIYEVNGLYVSITKGAFDYLNFLDSEANRKKYTIIHDELAQQAYRVLGVAYRIFDTNPVTLSDTEIEDKLHFAGFAGIIDPARKESFQAVSIAQQAGIQTIMITGDHLLTAKKIAEDVGILTKNTKMMSGSELTQLSDKELADCIADYRVFARTTPEDKLRLVKALQANDAIVAMTGDGVNDAPALKAADVGIAMGGGTEVAKEAADMILVDDNFATIIQAIEEGRRVYSNIRKSLYAMLGCNISALTIVLISMIAGFGAPVSAIQLLVVKIIADGIPGFSLSVEPAEYEIMKQPPIDKNESIFSKGLLKKIIEISIVFTMTTVMALWIGRSQTIEIAQTMTFIVLALTTIVHMYNCRSDNSAFKKEAFTGNPLLITTTMLSTIIIVLIVCIPQLQQLLGFVSLNHTQWLWVFALSLVPLLYIEAKKQLQSY